MLFFKDEEDFKGQIEHDIVWAEWPIKWNEEWIKREQYRIKCTADAELFKSVHRSIKKSENSIKGHRQRIDKWRQDYRQRYGHDNGSKPRKRPARKTGLMVIHGGQYKPGGESFLSDEFKAWQQEKQAKSYQHNITWWRQGHQTQGGRFTGARPLTPPMNQDRWSAIKTMMIAIERKEQQGA